ncbi:MAG: M48 family metalloprotease [Patescibacteria group bacterium]|jgi:Zn-dependent protease with chaperone function
MAKIKQVKKMLKIIRSLLLLVSATINGAFLFFFLGIVFEITKTKGYVTDLVIMGLKIQTTNSKAIYASIIIMIIIALISKTNFGAYLVVCFSLNARKPLQINNEIINKILPSLNIDKHFDTKIIKFLIIDEKDANAWAVGTHYVILSTGLLKKPIMQIRSVILHEIGHLNNNDGSYLIQLIATMITTRCIIKMCSIIINITGCFTRLPIIGLIILLLSLPFTIMAYTLIYGYINPICFLSTLISQKFEYNADKFAAENNGAKGMYEFLNGCLENYRAQSFLEKISDSHPSPIKRMLKLEKYLD